MCSKGDKMYYNRHDDKCEEKKDSRTKCCVRVTEYCCYPSYYTEENDDKCENEQTNKCEEKHDCPHKKECTCSDDSHHENHRETRPCRWCCPLFRHWC